MDRGKAGTEEGSPLRWWWGEGGKCCLGRPTGLLLWLMRKERIKDIIEFLMQHKFNPFSFTISASYSAMDMFISELGVCSLRLKGSNEADNLL